MTELPDFRMLARLAKENPTGFEELKQKLITEAISASALESQQRLKALQFNLDAKLDQCDTPQQRMHLAMSVMQSKLQLLSQALNGSEMPMASLSRFDAKKD